MMTNRSSHIPKMIEIEATTVPRIVRNSFHCKNRQRDDETQDEVEPEQGSKFPGQLRPEDGHVNRLITIKDGDIFGEGKIEP